MFTRHTEANIHFLFSDIFLLSLLSHESHLLEEGLTLETSALKLFTVANLRYQLN